MKIAFFEVEKEEQKYIKSKLKKHKLKFFEDNLDEKNIKSVKDSEILVVFVNSEVNKEVLDKFSNLKYVATMSTGFDHIDLEECKKRKINVSNVPRYGMNTVAEFTFGLILAVVRNIHKGIENTRKNNFDIEEDLEGFDLKGKTLGVIGPGSIGQHVIQYAKGFDMNVITYGRHRNRKLEKKFNCKFVPFNSLLKKSDIITIHVPLTKGTTRMINMKNIRKIKKGAFIINAARGEIIDTTALLYGLDKKIIRGAALDVLEGEGDIKEEKELIKKKMKQRDLKILKENHKLLKQHNVIVTPHIAFYTSEALQRIIDTTLENINSFFKGKVINNVIR